MSLEQIVRPFQSPRPLNTRRVIPSSTKAEPQTAGVTWGAAGTLPSARQSDADGPAAGISFNTKAMAVRQVERSREVETVRIEQPGNPENYVDVERIKKITFGQTNPVSLRSPSGATSATVAYAPPPGESQTVAPKTKATDGLIHLDPTEYELNPPA